MKYKILYVFFILFAFVGFCHSVEQPKQTVHQQYKVNDFGNFQLNGEAGEKILFIMDFSNSMNEYMGRETKLQVALRTIGTILPQLPPQAQTGLRVYGHRVGFTYFDGCTASKLISPIGSNNVQNIMYALGKVSASGWTPITYSLKQAVNKDFAGISGKKRIVLLTDGGENCDESPCTWAIQLMRERDDIFIDVIAFDVGDYEAQSQLRCTALATRGKFYEAKDAQELQKSLFESLNIDKDVKGTIKINP